VKLREMVEWQEHAGGTLALGDVSLTPLSRALVIRTPVGGYVWNRPVAVLIRRDGQEQRLPIANVLLRARLAMLGFVLTFAGLGLVYSALQRR
jgi:hypothetical protein